MPLEFLSCDWGTSSFRLRHVVDGVVRAEVREPAGVKSIYDSAAPGGKARADLFADYCFAKLEQIRAGGPVTQGSPLVISGMASSTIGWKELPYASAPISLSGEGLRVEKLDWRGPAWLGPTFLVSGVATDREMMRGEECQAVGLMALAPMDECLLILPGTHSKHIDISSGNLKDFRTFMTGELFDVLGRHTVLRATVDLAAPPNGHLESFGAGVDSAREIGLAAALFRARTRGVLAGRSGAENAAFLSGALIGGELVEATRGGLRIVIAAAGPLGDLYRVALEKMAPPGLVWSQLTGTLLDDATVAAHAAILGRQRAGV